MLKTGSNRSPSGDGHSSEPKLKQKGMSDKSAKFPDSSCGCGKGSVNNETTRSEVARSHSLSGRVA